MRRNCFIIIILLMIILLGDVFAQNPNPNTNSFKIFFRNRFRIEAWDNAVNLNDSANDAFSYTRNKISFGFKWNPAINIEILAKLTNEFKIFLSPKDRPFNSQELVFDQLYFKWKNPRGIPMTLTVGRQDILIAEDFITGDATPLDGSRTFYFNAVRMDYQLKKDHLFTFIINHEDSTDKILPVLHSQKQSIVEQPETGIFLYYSGKIRTLNLDLYYVRKNIEETRKIPIASGINAIGSRIKVPLIKDFAFVAEGNMQNGSYGSNDRLAFGGLFHFDYSVRNRIPYIKMFTLGGFYLTGDDPATARREAWDPLFGRWPKWSESYLYTLTRESSLAYWSNMNSIYTTITFDFNSYNVNGYFTYYHLGADNTVPSLFPGGTGKTRGDLLVYRMNYKANKYLNGVLIWEYFKPGNFYFKGASSYHWLRFELTFIY